MTKGAKMAEDYSKNKSLKLPPGMFPDLRDLCGRWDKSQSIIFRRALAVLADNPGLWEAYAEFAAPERLAEIERGE